LQSFCVLQVDVQQLQGDDLEMENSIDN
jgi:hypothetical protein